ncbi:hypothetical protein [Streptomyces sp. NPDC002386]
MTEKASDVELWFTAVRACVIRGVAAAGGRTPRQGLGKPVGRLPEHRPRAAVAASTGAAAALG